MNLLFWVPILFGGGGGASVTESAPLTGSLSFDSLYSGSLSFQSGSPMSSKLTPGSTNTVTVKRLYNKLTFAYPADATVVLTSLTDSSGAAVSGAANIPLTIVPGTSGSGTLYRGILPHTLPLAPGTFTGVATATDTSGNVHVFTVTVAAAA